METALTLQLDFTIPNDHEARLISRFVDSIPSEFLLGETSHTGHTDLRTTMNVYAQTSNKGTTRIVNALDHWLDKDNPLDFYPEVFCSEYSSKLNKILRENTDKNVIEFTLEDFKKALGIPPEYQTRHLKNNIIQKISSDLSEEWQAFDIETIYGKMRKILGYKITYGDNLVLKGDL